MAERFRLKRAGDAKSAPRVKKNKSTARINSLWQNRILGLDESLSITNAIIGSIGEGAIMVDEYGYISHANQAALDILGYERTELEGGWFQEALPMFDKDGMAIPFSERLLARALILGKPVADIINYKRKDGSLVPVYNTSSPFIVKGKPMGGIIVFRDVSKELQIERAKDEFVSLASHQLRTPLTSIRFFTELLKDPYYGKLTKKQAAYLDKISFSTERMINLVSELLNISRLNLGRLDIHPQPTSINNFVHNQLIEVTPIAKGSGVKLAYVSKVEESETALLDRTLLAQVIHNLLTNAIRYCSGTKQAKVTLTLKKTKSHYMVSVEDNGIGIPTAVNSRIYERFFRADNAIKSEAEGTGLGLYLVKSIIEATGGTIRHQSKETSGTTFYVTIPLSGMAPASVN